MSEGRAEVEGLYGWMAQRNVLRWRGWMVTSTEGRAELEGLYSCQLERDALSWRGWIGWMVAAQRDALMGITWRGGCRGGRAEHLRHPVLYFDLGRIAHGDISGLPGGASGSVYDRSCCINGWVFWARSTYPPGARGRGGGGGVDRPPTETPIVARPPPASPASATKRPNWGTSRCPKRHVGTGARR
eukprot:522217-Prorocentrum_minimum.AAC.1